MTNLSHGSLAVITPAHNEAELLEATIESVIAQTIAPTCWLIVDDASTDDTCEIVRAYQRKAPFIRYARLERDYISAYYSRRTHVFLAGLESLGSHNYEFLAALDADIELPAHYYQRILYYLHTHPNCGIASGVYEDVIKGKGRHVLRDPEHESTPGGIQVFRTECYRAIGGYKPLRYGGDDSLAVIEAHMHGWSTHAISDCRVLHHRPVGTRGGQSILKARYRQGLADFSLGTHPLFMIAKTLRRMAAERPLVIGSLSRFFGYTRHFISGGPYEVAPEVIAFVRRRQLRRLRAALWSS